MHFSEFFRSQQFSDTHGETHRILSWGDNTANSSLFHVTQFRCAM